MNSHENLQNFNVTVDRFFTFIGICAASSLCFAALPPIEQRPTYSIPFSTQPTGIKKLSELLAARTSEKKNRTQWLVKNSNTHSAEWIDQQNVLTGFDFSEHAETIAPLELKVNNKKVFTLPAQSRVRLLKSEHDRWLIEATVQNTKKTLWAPIQFLRPWSLEWGRGFVLQETELITNTNLPKAKLPLGAQVSILAPIDQFFDVIHTDADGKQQRGLIPQSQIFGRAQMANQFLLKDQKDWLSQKQWQQYRSAQGTQSLSRIEGFSIPAMTVAISKSSSSLKAWEPLLKTEVRKEEWLEAKIENQSFWWVNTLTDNSSVKTSFNKTLLTTKDLYQRGLFDMAAIPSATSSPKKIFASAKGVFTSSDGETWTRLDVFEEENYPILTQKNGQVFIGPYRSADFGRTFEPYIRWEVVLSLLARYRNLTPQELRIRDLQFEAQSKGISLLLEWGKKQHARVFTPDEGLTWQLLPSP